MNITYTSVEYNKRHYRLNAAGQVEEQSPLARSVWQVVKVTKRNEKFLRDIKECLLKRA